MNTTYFLDIVAGNVFHTRTSPALPTNYYLAVSTTAPTDTTTGTNANVTEPSGGGYARVPLTLSTPSSGNVSNSSSISFAEATTSWGTVSHFAIFDALTGGHILMYGALTPSRQVDAGTTLTISQGDLLLSVRNP